MGSKFKTSDEVFEYTDMLKEKYPRLSSSELSKIKTDIWNSWKKENPNY